MARVIHVKKARKVKRGHTRTCARCGKTIRAGESYSWFANRIGRSSHRKNYCKAHPPRPSDITTSSKLSTLYAAQESASDLLPKAETLTAIKDILGSCIEDGTQVGEEYGESLDNMPEGLQEGPTGQDIEQRKEACETWVSTMEDVVSEIKGHEDKEDPKTDEEKAARLKLVDDFRQSAEDAIGSLEL